MIDNGVKGFKCFLIESGVEVSLVCLHNVNSLLDSHVPLIRNFLTFLKMTYRQLCTISR